MHYFYIFMISLANNLDNIGVRIAYSVLGIKIRFITNLWISCITFIFSFGAAYCGKIVSGLLNAEIASIISALILITIGSGIILSSNGKRHSKNQTSKNWADDILENPEKADIDCSKDIDFKEASLLGIALSINNLGGGLGAGMIGLNSFYVGIFSAAISFLALWAGNYITDIFDKWHLGDKTTIIAGIALILIGLKQLLG